MWIKSIHHRFKLLVMIKYLLSTIVCFAFSITTFGQTPVFSFDYVTINNVSCTSSSDGKICWAVNNGIGPYYVNILTSTSSTSPIVNVPSDCIPNLGANTYSITVIDANGTVTSTTVVVAVSNPVLKIIATDTTVCNGDLVTLSPIYSTSGSVSQSAYCVPTFVSANQQNISQVIFGSINNASGCGAVGQAGSIADKYQNYTNLSATVTEGSNIPFSITIDTCYTGSTLNSSAIYIDFNANGLFSDPGELVYISAAAYNGPHTESGILHMPINLQKGIARMRVINVNGAPTNLAECGTFVSGEAEDYTIFFQQTPTSFYWNTISIDPTLQTSLLNSSTYTLVLDYGVGCEDTSVISLIPNPPTTVVITTNNIACSNASLSASVTGTASPFSYIWQPNFESTPSITGLSNLLYKVTITDANNCTTSDSLLVNLYPSLTSFPQVTNIACLNQGAQGSIYWNISGGTPVYNYTWNPPISSSGNANNLAAGTYTINVTDANGCTYTNTAIVTQPASVHTVLVSSVNITPPGNNGKAKAVASGGTPPYTFKWTPSGETTDSIVNKSPGTYTITTRDANGCTATEVVSFTSNGLQELELFYQLKLSPNPANNVLYVESVKTIKTIEIIDVLGKKMNQLLGNANTWNISTQDFANGIYFIRINGELVKRFEIQK